LKKDNIAKFEQIRKKTLLEAGAYKKNYFNSKIRVLGISGSARDKFDMAQEDSNTEWLLNKCLEECENLGAESKLIQLRKKNIKYCKACYSTTNAQCHFKCSCYPEGQDGDDMTNEIYDLCLWADIIVFASPVNNFKISSLMSLFIDRLISMDGSLIPADVNDTKNRDLNIEHTQFISKNANGTFGSGFLKRLTGKVAGLIVSGHEEGASMVISQMFMTLNHFGMVFPPFSNVYAMGSMVDDTFKDEVKIKSDFFEKDVKLLAYNLVGMSKTLKSRKNFWWKYDDSIN